MRIYTIEEVPVPDGHRYTRRLRVKIHERSIPNYGELIRWCRMNLKGWWILLEVTDRHMAGGCAPSTSQQWYQPDPCPRIKYYELRCHDEDAAAFVRSWTIPEREYERNKAYLVNEDNRARGSVEVDGKWMPIHKLVDFYESHQRRRPSMGSHENSG